MGMFALKRDLLQVGAHRAGGPNVTISIPVRTAGLVGLILVGLILSAVSCGYAGEGDYQSGGAWPLRYYSLRLPRVPFEEGVTRFRVRGLPKIDERGPLIRLTVFPQSPPVVCTRIDAQVSVELLDKTGELIAAGEGPLNALVERVNRAGTVSIPMKAGEWEPASLRYLDEGIALRAIPLEPGVDSLPQESCLFLVGRPWVERGALATLLALVRLRRIDAVIVRVASPRMGDELQVGLSETWK